RIPLHFHHAHDGLAALGRKRNRHAPAQILEVFPVIHLRLINNQSRAILVTFSWPTRITGLTRSCCGFGGPLAWRREKRADHDQCCSHGTVPPCSRKRRRRSASTQRGGYNIYNADSKPFPGSLDPFHHGTRFPHPLIC